MAKRWQLQEAKQRFSELIRAVEEDGPQIVTRHGKEVAVVIDIASFRDSEHETIDFKEFLMRAPDLSQLEIERDRTPARRVRLPVR